MHEQRQLPGQRLLPEEPFRELRPEEHAQEEDSAQHIKIMITTILRVLFWYKLKIKRDWFTRNSYKTHQYNMLDQENTKYVCALLNVHMAGSVCLLLLLCHETDD